MCQKWKHENISNTIERHISQLSHFYKNIDGFVRHGDLKVLMVQVALRVGYLLSLILHMRLESGVKR